MSDTTISTPSPPRQKTGGTLAIVSAVAGVVAGVLMLVFETTPPYAGWPPVAGPILYGIGLVAAVTLLVVYVFVQAVLAYLVKVPEKEAVRLRIAIFVVAAIVAFMLARGQGPGTDLTLETARIIQAVGIAILVWAGVVIARQMNAVKD